MLSRLARLPGFQRFYHQHRFSVAIALAGAAVWLTEELQGQHWHF